mgnify:CR=1
FTFAVKLQLKVKIKRLHGIKTADLTQVIVEIMQGKKAVKYFHSTAPLFCFRIMYFCNM